MKTEKQLTREREGEREKRRIGLFAGVVIGWSCSGSREMISIGVEADNATSVLVARLPFDSQRL